MNVANALTLLRLAAVPFLVLLLHEGRYREALVLFVLAGISDAVDGFVAKRFGQETQLGKVLDPIADKALVVTVYVALAWVALIPFWLVVAVVSRDLIIVGGALAYHYLTGALEMVPTFLSKLNTALQLALVTLVLVEAALPMGVHVWVDWLAVLVLVTTVASGLQYVVVWLRKAWAYEAGR
ncbi:CDP-alcohol phosphatidyltransferase family protein [Thiohalorhabdus sp. Cl-TMA]|uniref:CDP-diacylglycerol--glycerol-3-phosphate 3-phosphatidyltransferase n=1 Tax=Thiohalorhabdus methylotrophus TaxID=3242694 RepID=A0ABV4TQ00_9GAMM